MRLLASVPLHCLPRSSTHRSSVFLSLMRQDLMQSPLWESVIFHEERSGDLSCINDCLDGWKKWCLCTQTGLRTPVELRLRKMVLRGSGILVWLRGRLADLMLEIGVCTGSSVISVCNAIECGS